MLLVCINWYCLCWIICVWSIENVLYICMKLVLIGFDDEGNM